MPLMIIERLERGRVEPAAAARAPGDHAALLPDGGQVVPTVSGRVDGQLGRKRPAAHARGVGLGDAQHVVQHGCGPTPEPAAALPATQLLEVT
jgi:hypothetical protein